MDINALKNTVSNLSSFTQTTNDESNKFTTEELTITLLYYITAFLIIVISLVFINKRI